MEARSSTNVETLHLGQIPKITIRFPAPPLSPPVPMPPSHPPPHLAIRATSSAATSNSSNMERHALGEGSQASMLNFPADKNPYSQLTTAPRVIKGLAGLFQPSAPAKRSRSKRKPPTTSLGLTMKGRTRTPTSLVAVATATALDPSPECAQFAQAPPPPRRKDLIARALEEEEEAVVDSFDQIIQHLEEVCNSSTRNMEGTTTTTTMARSNTANSSTIQPTSITTSMMSLPTVSEQQPQLSTTPPDLNEIDLLQIRNGTVFSDKVVSNIEAKEIACDVFESVFYPAIRNIIDSNQFYHLSSTSTNHTLLYPISLSFPDPLNVFLNSTTPNTRTLSQTVRDRILHKFFQLYMNKKLFLSTSNISSTNTVPPSTIIANHLTLNELHIILLESFLQYGFV